MRLETEVIQVPNEPSEINALNEIEAAWGWSVQSVQVTEFKDSHYGGTTGTIDSTGYHGTTTIITEHTNYATITYQRDQDMPHYIQICALENEYRECEKKNFLNASEQQKEDECNRLSDAKYRDMLFGKIGIGVFVLAIIYYGAVGAVGVFVSVAIVAFFFLKAWCSPAYKDAENESYELSKKNDERRRAKRVELIQQARNLRA